MLLNEPFKVMALDFEMLADIRNLGGVALVGFFSDHRTAIHASAGYDKGVCNWRPLLQGAVSDYRLK